MATDRTSWTVLDWMREIAAKQDLIARYSGDAYLALSQYVNTRGEERGRELFRHGEISSQLLDVHKALEVLAQVSRDNFVQTKALAEKAAPSGKWWQRLDAYLLAKPHGLHARWRRWATLVGAVAGAIGAGYKVYEGIIEAMR